MTLPDHRGLPNPRLDGSGAAYQYYNVVEGTGELAPAKKTMRRYILTKDEAAKEGYQFNDDATLGQKAKRTRPNKKPKPTPSTSTRATITYTTAENELLGDIASRYNMTAREVPCLAPRGLPRDPLAFSSSSGDWPQCGKVSNVAELQDKVQGGDRAPGAQARRHPHHPRHPRHPGDYANGKRPRPHHPRAKRQRRR